MAPSLKNPPQDGRARLRPKLYGVALYLVAGILLLQVFFCLSVFFLRPYVKAKTPEGILQSEREKAGEWWGGLNRFWQARVPKDGVQPRETQPASTPPTALSP